MFIIWWRLWFQFLRQEELMRHDSFYFLCHVFIFCNMQFFMIRRAKFRLQTMSLLSVLFSNHSVSNPTLGIELQAFRFPLGTCPIIAVVWLKIMNAEAFSFPEASFDGHVDPTSNFRVLPIFVLFCFSFFIFFLFDFKFFLLFLFDLFYYSIHWGSIWKWNQLLLLLLLLLALLLLLLFLPFRFPVEYL